MEIRVDGCQVPALKGQTVAAALHAAGIIAWRHNPVTGERRGAFCGMGVCFECEVTIDGRPHQRACLVHVDEGMTVTTELAVENTSAQ